jgi:hypothetical protein
MSLGFCADRHCTQPPTSILVLMFNEQAREGDLTAATLTMMFSVVGCFCVIMRMNFAEH